MLFACWAMPSKHRAWKPMKTSLWTELCQPKTKHRRVHSIIMAALTFSVHGTGPRLRPLVRLASEPGPCQVLRAETTNLDGA